MDSHRRPVTLPVAWCAGLVLSATCVIAGCSSSDGSPATTTPPADASTGDAQPDALTDAQKEGASCVPATCSASGAQCGEIPDGCGGKVDCGAACPQGQFCGGAGPNKCGSEQCLPKTCAQLNASCGVVSDQCADTLDCGGCTAPDTCGGGGEANQCGSLAGTCGNGAVSSQCTCGSSVVNSGFCCGGIARATDCPRVRLDGGLVSGTSTFFGKLFAPLVPYLTAGSAFDSSEGITENYPIANTDYDPLYQNETWVDTSSPATFTIPIENGNYTVHLHFVDWVQGNAGERQFHVDLQGARVLTDLDIVSEAGKSTALVKSFDVAVTNGAVDLTITNHVFYAEIAAVEILPKGEAHLPTTGAAGNHAPTCNAGTDQAITLPTSSVTLAATATDPDSDPLSYAWTKTAGGAATIATPSAATTQITGLVAGAYTFTVTVDDGKGGIAADSVVVNVSTGAVVDPAWYVSPTGLDTNGGTSALEPFQTLERARTAARGPTTKTVYLLDGVYPRSAPLELEAVDAGESWLGFPGQTPILDGGSSTETGIVVKHQANDVTIRWLTLRDFALNGIFVGSWGSVQGAVIDSNTILNTHSDNWTQAAIMIGGTVTGAQLTHNLVDGAGYIGIGAFSAETHNISDLTIAHNAVYATCLTVADCAGIYVIDRAHASTNILIDNNVVGDYGSTSNGSKGIYLDDQLSNATARNNIIYGTGEWAIQYHGGDHNVFTNNIFDISGAGRLGLYQDAGQPNYGMGANSFTCNIVYSSAAPPSGLWNKYGYETVALPTVSDNLYWGTKGALPNTGDIIDSSPHVADPKFVNPASADYSFANGNPAAYCGFQPIDASQVGPVPNL